MKHLLAIVIVLTLAGCGSGGGSAGTNGAVTPADQLAGNWAGTYTAPGANGSLTLDIGADRIVSGQVSTAGKQANLAGDTFSGVPKVTFQYPGDPQVTTATFSLLKTSGHLRGTALVVHGNDPAVMWNVDLAAQ